MKIVRLLLATAMLLTASAHAADDGDRQTWNFVSIKYLDKKSLKLLIDANLLKDGKPSIYSTQQLTFFKDFP